MNGVEITNGSIKGQFDSYNIPAELTELESRALLYVKESFDKAGEDFDLLKFRRRSQDYLSILSPDDNDFFRIKATSRSVWFSVNGKILPKELQLDDRFNDVKKSLIHWKVKLNDISDLKIYADIILAAFTATK